MAHNYVEKLDDFEHLEKLLELSVLDLANNHIEDPLIVEVLGKMPGLRVLNLMGNPVIRKIPAYRKTLILACKDLQYLDDRPVFPRERACAEAWQRGGITEENAERQRWINRERQKIMDSVNAIIAIRDRHIAARRQQQMQSDSGHGTSVGDSESETESLHLNDNILASNDNANNEALNAGSSSSSLEEEERVYNYGREGELPDESSDSNSDSEDDFMKDRQTNEDYSAYRERIFDFSPRGRSQPTKLLVEEIPDAEAGTSTAHEPTNEDEILQKADKVTISELSETTNSIEILSENQAVNQSDKEYTMKIEDLSRFSQIPEEMSEKTNETRPSYLPGTTGTAETLFEKRDTNEHNHEYIKNIEDFSDSTEKSEKLSQEPHKIMSELLETIDTTKVSSHKTDTNPTDNESMIKIEDLSNFHTISDEIFQRTDKTNPTDLPKTSETIETLPETESRNQTDKKYTMKIDALSHFSNSSNAMEEIDFKTYNTAQQKLLKSEESTVAEEDQSTEKIHEENKRTTSLEQPITILTNKVALNSINDIMMVDQLLQPPQDSHQNWLETNRNIEANNLILLDKNKKINVNNIHTNNSKEILPNSITLENKNVSNDLNSHKMLDINSNNSKKETPIVDPTHSMTLEEYIASCNMPKMRGDSRFKTQEEIEIDTMQEVIEKQEKEQLKQELGEILNRYENENNQALNRTQDQETDMPYDTHLLGNIDTNIVKEENLNKKIQEILKRDIPKSNDGCDSDDDVNQEPADLVISTKETENKNIQPQAEIAFVIGEQTESDNCKSLEFGKKEQGISVSYVKDAISSIDEHVNTVYENEIKKDLPVNIDDENMPEPINDNCKNMYKEFEINANDKEFRPPMVHKSLKVSLNHLVFEKSGNKIVENKNTPDEITVENSLIACNKISELREEIAHFTHSLEEFKKANQDKIDKFIEIRKENNTGKTRDFHEQSHLDTENNDRKIKNIDDNGYNEMKDNEGLIITQSSYEITKENQDSLSEKISENSVAEIVDTEAEVQNSIFEQISEKFKIEQFIETEPNVQKKSLDDIDIKRFRKHFTDFGIEVDSESDSEEINEFNKACKEVTNEFREECKQHFIKNYGSQKLLHNQSENSMDESSTDSEGDIEEYLTPNEDEECLIYKKNIAKSEKNGLNTNDTMKTRGENTRDTEEIAGEGEEYFDEIEDSILKEVIKKTNNEEVTEIRLLTDNKLNDIQQKELNIIQEKEVNKEKVEDTNKEYLSTENTVCEEDEFNKERKNADNKAIKKEYSDDNNNTNSDTILPRETQTTVRRTVNCSLEMQLAKEKN